MSEKVNYWDYVGIDTLLNLQRPKTEYEDEHIFIIYHQINELFFKLIINELSLLTDLNKKEFLEQKNWVKRLGRIINNFNILTESISVLMPDYPVFRLSKRELKDAEISDLSVSCFDNDQFLKFRDSLVPASGFQSVQYRIIEIMSTELKNLVHPSKKAELENEDDIEIIYQNLYWKYGARIVKNDNISNPELLNKADTLIEFENKYDDYLIELSKEFINRNLCFLYKRSYSEVESDRTNLSKVKDILVYYDKIVNRQWKGVHYGLALEHLKDSIGTGGTNWKQYLSISKNDINFFDL